MAQLSRPYQIALAALGLFAVVWFVALHRPGSGPGSGPGSSPSSPSAPAVAKVTSPAAPTSVYHGAAPGVEGLTRAVAKAHGAVGQSEQNAQQLQSKSAQASGEAAATGTGSASGAGSANANTSTAGSARASAPATQRSSTSGAAAHRTQAHRSASTRSGASSAASAQATRQTAVLQSELKHGQMVLLLFWNPKSTDDVAVRQEAQATAARLKGKVALHVALANQVGRYGSVTRNVQVYQTPTLLIVNRHGLAVTLTGLMDKYSIEQAVIEAKQASHGA